LSDCEVTLLVRRVRFEMPP